MGADTLVELEALRQFKARYWRLPDAKDRHAWRQLLTDDAVTDTTASKAAGGWRIKTPTLTRLRMDLVTPILSFKLPASWLRARTH